VALHRLRRRAGHRHVQPRLGPDNADCPRNRARVVEHRGGQRAGAGEEQALDRGDALGAHGFDPLERVGVLQGAAAGLLQQQRRDLRRGQVGEEGEAEGRAGQRQGGADADVQDHRPHALLEPDRGRAPVGPDGEDRGLPHGVAQLGQGLAGQPDGVDLGQSGQPRGDRQRADEAREMFNEVLSERTALGLLSEDIHTGTGELWGNFPQTYSMVGIINAAARLSRSWEDTV